MNVIDFIKWLLRSRPTQYKRLQMISCRSVLCWHPYYYHSSWTAFKLTRFTTGAKEVRIITLCWSLLKALPNSRGCRPLLITAYYEKTICQVFNCLLHNHCCSSRYRMFRGHFRHRSKGGGSLNVTPRHALQTIFLSFYSQRLLKSLQETLPAVFWTKLRLIHHVRLFKDIS